MRFSEQAAGVDRSLDVRSAREQRRGVRGQACRVAEGDVERAGKLEERVAAHARGEVARSASPATTATAHVELAGLAEDVTDDLPGERGRVEAPLARE